jgi:hypothetical protein
MGQSILASFWWALVTMTTVGYGDAYPITVAGKIVAATATVTGLLVIAFPITIIGVNLNDLYEEEREQQARKERAQARARAASSGAGGSGGSSRGSMSGRSLRAAAGEQTDLRAALTEIAQVQARIKEEIEGLKGQLTRVTDGEAHASAMLGHIRAATETVAAATAAAAAARGRRTDGRTGNRDDDDDEDTVERVPILAEVVDMPKMPLKGTSSPPPPPAEKLPVPAPAATPVLNGLGTHDATTTTITALEGGGGGIGLGRAESRAVASTTGLLSYGYGGGGNGDDDEDMDLGGWGTRSLAASDLVPMQPMGASRPK